MAAQVLRLLPPALLLLCSCSVVKMHRLRPDYEQVDRTRTKRLSVVVELEGAPEKVGELFALVARRYVNQKRNFLAKEHAALPGPLSLPARCGGMEGVLWLSPSARSHGSGMEVDLRARLLRCSDGEEIWAAEAAGSFATVEEGLKEVTAQYAAELGPEVAPYVPPALNLLRPTLDTLPNPQLTEQEVEEKIELGE